MKKIRKYRDVMKIIKKILKVVLIIIVTFVLLCVAADCAWIFIPQVKASQKLEFIADHKKSIDQIDIPESATVIGLGEATHGNSTFQEMKLSVFEQLVDNYGVRAFVIEGDFGEGLIINDYIHGKNDIATASDAVHNLSFNIYHTQQMIDLVQWMRDYNDSCAEGDEVSFYGFDLQNPEAGAARVVEYCKNSEDISVDITPLESFANRAENDFEYDSEGFKAVIPELKKVLEERLAADADDIELKQLIRILDNCQAFIELAKAYSSDIYTDGYNCRDKYMAEIVMWISEFEQELGNEKIMIAGHNGHIGLEGVWYTSMGRNLKDALGDKYFAIGTDYYKTNCNINNEGADNSRGNHSFTSADVLAYNAKYYDGSYYLRFDELSDNADAMRLFESGINMGSLGEGYSFMMKILPSSHRINGNPMNYFDSMIFVYKAEPIEVLF